MSAAANNWLKDRPLLTVLFSFLSSLILLFTARAVEFNDTEKAEFKKELQEKVDADYVNAAIIAHEDREEQIIDPMKKDIQELKDEDKIIRVEFLEEVRLLRKDIMDIYKQKSN